ncbi:MAG: TauD/TfdA family dioxygenase [Polyangiales bacterium]
MQDAFEQSSFGDEPLPLVLSPKRETSRERLLELLAAHKDELHAKLLEHGGLLFRGFPIESAADFGGVVERLATGPSVNYIGGDSPRNKVHGSIYTSTEAPADVKIPLHNELSFVRNHPKHIFFCCETPPVEHGETIIGDSRRIFHALDPAVRQRFVDKRLRYVSCYFNRSLIMDMLNALQPAHKSWREVFETEDRAEVERLCREHDFELSWHGKNWLRIMQTRPAATTHPVTHEEVWFCQPHLYDFNPRLLGTAWRYVGAKIFYARPHTRLHEVFYADGSRIARGDLYHILDVLDQNTIAFPWQHGDVMMLDNVLSMHGRATFQGRRRILAALTS